ncbi:MAG: VWA domain-containing protein [Bacteroidia bacterium]
MTKYEHPEAFYLLLLLLPLLGLFVAFLWGRRRAVRRLGEYSLVAQLMPGKPVTKHLIKFVLAALALAMLVVTLANPQIGQSFEKVQRKGVDLMIAIDISRSMLAEDVKPNRMEQSKLFVSRLLDRLTGDRVGLILFAGNAYLQTPLTTDYAALKTILRTVNTDLAGTQGTAIGEAVRMADEAFDRSQTEYRALLIISDGEDHEEGALDIARQATEKGMTIYTMGVGTAKGGPIPEYYNGRQVGFKQDRSGSIVLSRLDEAMLQKVAATGRGEYFHLTQGAAEAQAFISELGTLEQQEFEDYVFTDYEDYFQVFLAFALLFICLEYLFSERRNMLFTDWKIFR